MAMQKSMDHPSGSGLRGTKSKFPGDESSTDPVERLNLYLKPTEECMEGVQKMPPRKFNTEQCGYLAGKLQVVIESARSFLEVSRARSHGLGSSENMERNIDNFKLLLTLANEIKSFIEGCCRKDWIQAAMTLTNVSEYVSLIGFNLELCRVAFDGKCAASGRPLTLDEVANIYNGEVEVVEKKASADVAEVNRGLTEKSLSGKEKELAGHLVRRLQRVKIDPNASFESFLLKDKMKDLFKWCQTGKQIGSGAFATVYDAMWLGTRVAKKTFRRVNYQYFVKEAEILAGLFHPNVTSAYCHESDRWGCSIIMELMDKDLLAFMEDRCKSNFTDSPFSILEAVDLMLQVGEGVNYLHSKVVPSIVHRDLKSSNILVKCVTGTKSGYVQAKVTDFGLSKTKDCSIRYSLQTPNTGTCRWMAPEVIKLGEGSQGSTSDSAKEPNYPKKSDVYSFGMVCYEILSGDIPFQDIDKPNSVKEMILKGSRPVLPRHCPPELKDLIEECWSQEPLKRPSFPDICLKLKYVKYLLMTGFSSNQNLPLPPYKEPSGTKAKVMPLKASTNIEPSLETIQATYTIQDHSSPLVSDGEQARVQRLIKGILDTITPQNFDSLYDQVQEANIDSATTLISVVSQIYDKALTAESTLREMCTQLCVKLDADLPEFSENGTKITFKHVLSKLLVESERGDRGEGAKKDEEEQVEKKMTANQRKKKRQKVRKRMIGNISFIGELFKKGMLSETLMHERIKKLLGDAQDPYEEDVEALCILMNIIVSIDHHKAKEFIYPYFRRMASLSNNVELSVRHRSMLKDCIELWRNDWQESPREAEYASKRIDEVHRVDAVQERQQAARGDSSERDTSISEDSARGRMGLGPESGIRGSPSPMYSPGPMEAGPAMDSMRRAPPPQGQMRGGGGLVQGMRMEDKSLPIDLPPVLMPDFASLHPEMRRLSSEPILGFEALNYFEQDRSQYSNRDELPMRPSSAASGSSLLLDHQLVNRALDLDPSVFQASDGVNREFDLFRKQEKQSEAGKAPSKETLEELNEILKKHPLRSSSAPPNL